MKFIKITSLSLVTTILFALGSFSASTAYASEINNANTPQVSMNTLESTEFVPVTFSETYDKFILSDDQIAEILKAGESEGVYPSISERGGASVALKAAKWILKNRKTLTNLIGKVDRKWAVEFGEALVHIEGPLRQITAVEDAGMNIIRGIIFDGVFAVTGNDLLASSVAGAAVAIIELYI